MLRVRRGPLTCANARWWWIWSSRADALQTSETQIAVDRACETWVTSQADLRRPAPTDGMTQQRAPSEEDARYAFVLGRCAGQPSVVTTARLRRPRRTRATPPASMSASAMTRSGSITFTLFT